MDAMKKKLLATGVELSRMAMFVDKMKDDMPEPLSTKTLLIELPVDVLVEFGKVGTMGVTALVASGAFTVEELEAAVKDTMQKDMLAAAQPPTEEGAGNATEDDSCPCPNCTARRALGMAKPTEEQLQEMLARAPGSAGLRALRARMGAAAEMEGMGIVSLGSLQLAEGENPIEAIAKFLGARMGGAEPETPVMQPPVSTKYKH